ncbi:nuclear transport factor 2 family protein [Joostella sp. CR20]|uniref:nuclear transport factor 2 family protein n=1 Tax=Joostella sp. CR20 TaxID=2804312 RepID=UPI00313AF99B
MNEDSKQEKVEIMTVVRKLATLMIEKDTNTMNNILDEDYTLTHITGYVQPKEEWFLEVEKESMKYYSAEEIAHSITIENNRAEVVVKNLVDARIWGSRNTWRLQQKMTLEKRNEKWIILKSVATTF